jgi:hypothetical protein
MSGTGIRYNLNTDHGSVFGGSLFSAASDIQAMITRQISLVLWHLKSFFLVQMAEIFELYLGIGIF